MANQTKFQGATVKVAGTFISKGKVAPDFQLIKNDLSRFSLADGRGKRLLLNIFPSIDTPVCAISVRTFNKMASEMDNTLVLCISKDLPFAQSRFCGAEGLNNVMTLSDYLCSSSFGLDYGVQMIDGPLNGLFARAVIVINEKGVVTYSHMTEDVVNEPDYQGALAALS